MNWGNFLSRWRYVEHVHWLQMQLSISRASTFTHDPNIRISRYWRTGMLVWNTFALNRAHGVRGNTQQRRETTPAEDGAEFHNRIASTRLTRHRFHDTAERDATQGWNAGHTARCGCAQRRQPPRRRRLTAYDTKLFSTGVSYQAANQSSCHNGADVAAATTMAGCSGGGGGDDATRRRAVAFDIVVEFSSRLPQTVLVYFGDGARARSTDRAGSLRQIFTNNNRHPSFSCDNGKVECQHENSARAGEDGRSKWRHRFAICLVLVARHHFLTRFPSYRFPSARYSSETRHAEFVSVAVS